MGTESKQRLLQNPSLCPLEAGHNSQTATNGVILRVETDATDESADEVVYQEREDDEVESFAESLKADGYITVRHLGPDPKTQFFDVNTRPGSVVRYGNWKLHEYFENGSLELYNLQDDIGEKNNLADQEPEKLQELHRMLITWRHETAAPVPTEWNPGYEP